MVAVLFMSQSWVSSAAYADYLTSLPAEASDSVLEGSVSTQDELVSEEKEADATTENNESQVAQKASSEEASETAIADSAASNQLTAKNVSVSAHVQNIGWMNPVGSGKIAGTTGKGLNLEALKISLEVDGASSQEEAAGAVSVEAHVAGLGWRPAVGNGEVAGTTGQSRAVEALRVRLSAELSERYSVWYRVHSAGFGWLGWARDGADAGSAGYGRAAQAVQVAVLPKGDPAPGDTAAPFVDRSSEPPSVSYRAHVAGIGWQGAVSDGAAAGTTGQGRALEALSGSVSWYGHGSSSLEVRAHVSSVGWQGWTSGAAGTTGRSLAVEALQLRLSGEAASSYDVWYRVHCSGYGWLGWAKDGASAGTVGLSKAVQAVQVVLVPKGGDAPGPAAGAFRGAGERLSGSALSVSGSPAGSSFSGGVLTLGSEGGPVLGSVAAVVDNLESDGSVGYRGLLLGSGWQGESSSDGAQLVATGGGLQLKAVRFELSGGLAERYDVWYRSCDSSRGWLGWASAGEPSGVESGASGLTAVQVALVAKGAGSPGPAEGAFVSGAASGPALVLQGHVAARGWLPAVGGGEDVGTTGRGLALQAVRASLEGAGEGGSVSVAAHVAGIGWQDAASAPSYAGTVGQGRAVQAVRVSLSGPVSERYDVWYRVHAAGYGWLGWAKDGEAAGTEGLGVQAEALQAVLVEKGGDAPSSGAPAELCSPSLSLRAHVSGVGWQAAVGDGGTAGTTGQDRAVEAITAEVSSTVSGGLSYSAHVSGVGWQDEVSDGALAGTTGQGRAVECVKMRLTGDISNYFDVWYRVHVSDYGWLGWTKNGSPAGTTKLGIPVQALQVKIVPKGAAAPGSTFDSYFETYRYIGYQTPGSYPKVNCNSVQLPSYCTGYFTYVTPSRIPYNASLQDCINAFIQRARDYIGTRYIEPWSSWPGDAVDCSGLVLQCLYATGMDMGWYNPYNHRWLPEQTYNSMNWYRNNTFMPVSTSALQRGDVVYYQGHIGIYIGNGRIIDSWPGIGVTERSVNAPGRVIGAARPFA